MKKDNIILIGFMGSGKTTVGIKLSYKRKQTMIDTDKWIERKQNQTISQLFATKGETCFRQLETDCLQTLLESANGQIISVGGGLPVNPANHELLRQLGTIVYLKVSAGEVYRRLRNDTTRPLLQGENPKRKIQDLLAKRAPIYEQLADLVIDETDKNLEAVAVEIMEKLQ